MKFLRKLRGLFRRQKQKPDPLLDALVLLHDIAAATHCEGGLHLLGANFEGGPKDGGKLVVLFAVGTAAEALGEFYDEAKEKF